MRSLFLRHIAQTSPDPMLLEIVRGEGCFLIDKDGKKYLDLISGISVSNIGHSNTEVLKAIHRQTDLYLHTMVFGEYVQTPQVKLAQKLAGYLPAGLHSVFYTNSGSEAIEGALKLAKKATGRSTVMAMKNAYHGSTHGALSLMSNPYFTSAFRPLVPGVEFMDYNDASQVKRIGRDTAAVIVEPVQSESGYNPAGMEFIQALRKRCYETGALLIFDEIQTGMGRTGKLFALEHYETTPDILCLAKAFGGGMPLGAFISSRELMLNLTNDPVLGHITTFGGHPVSCAAALAALNEIIDRNLLKSVEEKASLFRSLLHHPQIHRITGKGLMISVRLSDKEFLRKVVGLCIQKGLIIDWFLFAENYLRIAPPLIISNDEIRTACRIILESLDEASGT